MYIPPYYKEEDTGKLLDFMRANSFALLTGHSASGLQATHLPFVVEEMNGKISLVSHLSAANPHRNIFESHPDALVVFSGPHAYISPSNYEKQQNVPTWNYIAVHARGKVRVISGKEQVLASLKKMIEAYEEKYMEQFKGLSGDYVEAMLKGIVAFEVMVEKLEGKYKLSQNKTQNEQKKIIASLERSAHTWDKEIAEAMKQNLGS